MKKRVCNSRLKYERQLHNWSQQKVADMIGSTVGNVSRWERGATSPSPYFRLKLCELFDKDAVALGLLSGPENEAETTLLSSSDQQAIYDPAIPLPFMTTNDPVGRDQLIEQLKQQLPVRENVPFVAFHGLPGVGKTALAIALTSDSEVRAEFCDGMLWAGLGTQPNIPEILSRWGLLFGVATCGTRALREAIGTRRMLIVIDDAWTINDAIALTIGGPHCAYLMTTRLPHLAASFAAQRAIAIPELCEEDGTTLLHHLAPEIMRDDAERVHALVRSVGALPLALMLVGRYLHVQGYRGQGRRLRAAMEQLQDIKQCLQLSTPIVQLEAHPSLPIDTPLSLQSVIGVSDQSLDEQAHQALRALSVFPAKPNTFSEEAALVVSTASKDVLDRLGLLEVDAASRYTIHKIIVDYARATLNEQAPTQRFAAYYETYRKRNGIDDEALELERHNILAALGKVSVLPQAR